MTRHGTQDLAALGVAGTWFTDVLSWIAPVLIFFGHWYAMNRKLAGKGGAGLLGIGQSKAKIYMRRRPGAQRVDDAVRGPLQGAFERALAILRENRCETLRERTVSDRLAGSTA